VKPSASAADIADETTDDNPNDVIADDDDGIVHGSSLSVDVGGKSSTYNLPCCMPAIRRRTCTQFLPFCPTFAGCAWVQQRLSRGGRDEASVSVPPPTVTQAATDRRDGIDEQIELN